jgi:hypothetical protein
MRGSQPGERRGGRAKGTPNHSTQDIRAICAAFHDSLGGVEVMLRDLYTRAESPALQLDIIKFAASYQFGKPKESVAVDVSGDIVNLISDARKRASQGE